MTDTHRDWRMPAVNQEQQISRKVTCPKKRQAERWIDRSYLWYKLSTNTTWIENQRIGYTNTIAERVTNGRGGGYTTCRRSTSLNLAPFLLTPPVSKSHSILCHCMSTTPLHSSKTWYRLVICGTSCYSWNRDRMLVSFTINLDASPFLLTCAWMSKPKSECYFWFL